MFAEIRDFLTLKKKRVDIDEAVDFSESVRELMVYTINAKSSLGWIVWKESEASLIRLLERVFMAVKVDLEFTNEYNVFIIKVLAPSNQIERMSTYIKGKQLQDEIDRIHRAYNDVVLSFNPTALDGSDFKGKNTLDVLNERIKALIEIDFTRKREINALDTQFEALKEHVEGAMADFEQRYETQLEIKCLSKFDAMEKKIIKVVDQDLNILRGDINAPISDLESKKNS